MDRDIEIEETSADRNALLSDAATALTTAAEEISPRNDELPQTVGDAPGGAIGGSHTTTSDWTLDQARHRLEGRIQTARHDEDSLAIQILLREHDGLKAKVSKLKSLLGRSAQAQRESKVDLEATQKRLEQSLREIERLNKKIEKLSTRPTHMELLADFERNFDRALLSIGSKQSGGEDTAPPSDVSRGSNGINNNSLMLYDEPKSAAVDGLLMQELSECKQRIDKLESLNSALVHRSSQLELEVQARTRERDTLADKFSRLELEKRMAEMEAERSVRELERQKASCAEMQLEIDLLTKASVTANARAAHGEEIIKTVKTDRQHIHELEAKVQALHEWALASSEAKTLAQERVRFLENQLKALQRNERKTDGGEGGEERIILSKGGSFVVGAGDCGVRVFTLTAEQVKAVRLSERVILRWRFDLMAEDADIVFSILRGNCETVASRLTADYVVKNRSVKGGAAGEAENAFTSQRACTILWDNTRSWIRPKTVKFEVHVVVISDEY